MVILRFNGGLGNQLFQYALYKKLEGRGRAVKADLRDYEQNKDIRLFYLDYFGIKVNCALNSELFKFAPDYGLLNKIKNRIGQMKFCKEEASYVFDYTVLETDDIYIQGYWQCPKYFDDIRSDLLRAIVLPRLPEDQQAIRDKMLAENSVSVHVRLGDYLKFDQKYGGICTEDYYSRAFEYIERRVEDPVYYGFSDDPELAKKMFHDRSINWLNFNDEKKAYNDLSLMSSCKHNIIANSSFSWWGAYLGDQDKRIVVSPSKWVNTSDACDIWCEDWVRV